MCSNDTSNETEIQTVEPPFINAEENDTDQTTIIGIVLAAGNSSRFGDKNKLLSNWDDNPLVWYATQTLANSVVDTIVVVVGYEADRVTRVIEEFNVQIVRNTEYEAGQATSVKRGLAVARDYGADAAIFSLGDMPKVSVASIDRLVAAYQADIGDALAAAYNGVRGNPVLFGARHFSELGDVSGDRGGRDILLSDERSALVETDDPGVLLDVDSHRDLAKL